MVKYISRILNKSSYRRFKLYGWQGMNNNLKYDYKYFEAESEKDCEIMMGDYFRKVLRAKKRFPMRAITLDYKRLGDKHWLRGPFRAKVFSQVYTPTFDELEDWEDRQLLLFPMKKREFLSKFTEIDEDGWKCLPQYKYFRAFSLEEAINKVKKFEFGIDFINNSIGEVPTSNLSTLEVKASGRQDKWICLYDNGTPERPTADGNPFAHKAKSTVISHAFGVIAKMGRRMEEEKECFPALRRRWEEMIY